MIYKLINLIVVITTIFILANKSWAISPTGQGIFLVNSCSTISNPIAGQSWCVLANSNPPTIFEYINGNWTLVGIPTYFGGSTASTDNSTALNAAVASAYETGTNQATAGKVVIGPDGSGGTTYKFTQSIDLKEVPVECVGPSSANSPGLFNITLDFTGMPSGVALKDVGYFHNCRVIGAFTPGSGLSATISSISESGENTVSVTTSSSNTIVPGVAISISGTTNYNGEWVVASVNSPTNFTFQISGSSLATETAGTINYYPTVGIAAHNPSSASLACCAVDWRNTVITGFGTAYSLNAVQTTNGSTDNWVVHSATAQNSPVGFQALGNYRNVSIDGANVAAGVISDNIQCVDNAICFDAGPSSSPSTSLNDPEENGFGDNQIGNLTFEAADTSSHDSAYVAGFWGGAYGNQIYQSYMPSGGSAGVGQVAEGSINTAPSAGSNIIENNRLGFGNQFAVTDIVRDNVSIGTSTTGMIANPANVGAASIPGTGVQSGYQFDNIGTTANPITAIMEVNGSVCTPGGTGCNCSPHSFGLVAHDYTYSGSGVTNGTALPSTGFICPDGSYVASGGSCPANTGLCSYSSTSYEIVCWSRNLNIVSFDVLEDNTSTSTALNFGNGANGNNCYPVSSSATAAYISPTVDSTGGILESNSNAYNSLGPTNFTGTSTVNGSTILTTSPIQYLVSKLPSYENTVLAASPSAYWRLNGTSPFTDSSGNSNSGTSVGGVTTGVTPGAITDEANAAVTLNGTTGAITVASSASLPSGDTFGVEGWFKRAGNIGAPQDLVSQVINGAEVRMQINNTIALYLNGGVQITDATMPAVTDTTIWHWFAVTKNGSSVHILFDGSDVTLGTLNQTLTPSSAALYLGENSTSTAFWDGSLDEVTVYSTPPSVATLLTHYVEGRSAKNGLFAYATDGTTGSCPISGSSSGAEAIYANGQWCALTIP